MTSFRYCHVRAFSLYLVALAFIPTVMAGPVPGGMGRKEEPKKADARKGIELAPDKVLKFTVDDKSKRNEVVFISKTPKETIKGKAGAVVGNLKGNLHTLEKLTGTFEVAWADLDTGKPMMNEHMLADPWVDAKSHPKIVFTLTSLTPEDKQPKNGKSLRATLAGKMAMNGHEKEIEVPATIAYVPAGESKSGKPVKERVSIRAKFDVALADFGIKGRGIGQGVAATQNINVSLVMRPAKNDDSKSADGTKPKTKKKKKKDDSEA